MQRGVLFRRKLLAGEDNHGQLAERSGVANAFQYLESRHIRKAKIEDDAVVALLPQRSESFPAGRGHGNVDVVMAKQRLDRRLFGVVIFHHEQPFTTRTRVGLDFVQGVSQAIGGGGLGYKREGSTGQALLTVFIEREHLYRNVASSGILLEMVQYRPAQHIWQEYIE